MQTQVEPERTVAPFLAKPILVPLDGSQIAGGILPYIAQVARKARTSLMLLTVVDPDANDYPTHVLGPFPLPKDDTRVIYKDQVEESERLRALGRLNDMAAALKAQGITASTRATMGKPAEEIMRVAFDEGCGLIAMSTHGRHAICRGILGSVTDKVIHASRIPVMTITPERAKEYEEQEGNIFENVIVPLDGSELAERSLPYAEALSRLLSLDIVLSRVAHIEYPSYAYAESAFGLTDYLSDLTEQGVGEAANYLQGVSQRLRHDGFTVRTHVLRGAAAPALLDLAHKTSRSLVVMTTHGRSGFARWTMGSVSEALIRGAGEPVLVVPNLAPGHREHESETNRPGLARFDPTMQS